MDIDFELVLIDNVIYCVNELCVLVVKELNEVMELGESCLGLFVFNIWRR